MEKVPDLLVMFTLGRITETTRPVFAHVMYSVKEGAIMTIALYDTEQKSVHQEARYNDSEFTNKYYISDSIKMGDIKKLRGYVASGRKGFESAKERFGADGYFVELDPGYTYAEILQSMRDGGVLDVLPGCDSTGIDSHIGNPEFIKAVEKGHEDPPALLGEISERYRPFVVVIHWRPDGGNILTVGIYDKEKKTYQLRTRAKEKTGEVPRDSIKFSDWKKVLSVDYLRRVGKELRKKFNVVNRELGYTGTFLTFSIGIPYEELCKQLKEEVVLSEFKM